MLCNMIPVSPFPSEGFGFEKSERNTCRVLAALKPESKVVSRGIIHTFCLTSPCCSAAERERKIGGESFIRLGVVAGRISVKVQSKIFWYNFYLRFYEFCFWCLHKREPSCYAKVELSVAPMNFKSLELIKILVREKEKRKATICNPDLF